MDTTTLATTTPDQTLAGRWQALQAAEPNLRIRSVADRLGVSEMELVRLRGEDALIPLQNRFAELLKSLETVGPVMILTRNNEAVHEVTGTFSNFTAGKSGAMGLAVGEIDIRVFFNNWAWGYWVREEVRSGLRESLQFFDRYGTAVHKIYRVEQTDARAWAGLLADYRGPRLAPFVAAGKREVPARVPVAEVNAELLREGWQQLKDVHHFNALLKRAGTDRLTALEIVRGEWATELQRTDGEVLDCLLTLLRDNLCPAMFFVGNPGIVQIYTGQVVNLRRTGSWMNVLDDGFNLHANTDEVRRWWVVRRPSTDGLITSVEAFNNDGELVLTVFGARKPGIPESDHWRAQVSTLEALS